MTKRNYRRDAETLFWVVFKLERVYHQTKEPCKELIRGGHGVYFWQLSRKRNFVNVKGLSAHIGAGSRAVLAEIERLDPNRLVKPIFEVTQSQPRRRGLPLGIKEKVQDVIRKFEQRIKDGKLEPPK